MAQQVSITFDCGFQAAYPLPREARGLSPSQRGLYEAMADAEHDQQCQACKRPGGDPEEAEQTTEA